MCLQWQPVIGKRHDIGIKRISNQRHMLRVPMRGIKLSHRVNIGGDLLGRLLPPELLQAIPANDRNAIAAQLLGNGLIQVALSAIVGQHGCQGRLGDGVCKRLRQHRPGQRRCLAGSMACASVVSSMPEPVSLTLNTMWAPTAASGFSVWRLPKGAR
jgi:hypothetical protein